MIACSAAAWERLQRLKEIWEKQEPETELVCMVKCASLPELSEKESLTECVGKWFSQVDAIVFLCASGIAVRSIAPWIVHKSKDPAVIVMDETGKFCISLLSGHWGGANALAEKLARMTGAIPVITTATDREEKFAVDAFARKNNLELTDWKLAKRISARILEGERIGFYSEILTEGTMPKELFSVAEPEKADRGQERMGSATGSDCCGMAWELYGQSRKQPDGKVGIAVSCRNAAQRFFAETLLLVPRIVVAGIGCKRETAEEKIDAAIRQCLEEEGIHPEAVCAVASIDLKREEAGILSYCNGKGLPFLTFSAEALKRAAGDFSESAFVESVTGVSNVCERSAVAAACALSGSAWGGEKPAGELVESEKKAETEGQSAAGGVLLCRKKVYGGVTVALAQKKASVRF